MHQHNIAIMQMMYIQNICDSNLLLSFFLAHLKLRVRSTALYDSAPLIILENAVNT